MRRKGKVIIALSGGVDSSVTAALLKRAGFDLVGVFMKFWNESEKENRCCSVESASRARKVAQQLDFPFYVLNQKKEFKKEIVDYFIKEYKEGRTPNPCVLCNKKIKFEVLLRKMKELKADFVATGHYAKTKDGKLYIPKDIKKDQTYFLWKLKKDQLKKILFPLEGLTKKEVRELAREFGLATAEQKESQEVCFVSKTDDFLQKHLKENKGKIVSKEGDVLGEHKGLFLYTIGQRKRIGLSGGPFFVCKKDYEKNELVIDKEEIEKKELYFSQANFLSDYRGKVKVRIRYRSPLVSGTLYKDKVVFDKPQKSITPGQSVVFYNKKEIIGGGVIVK